MSFYPPISHLLPLERIPEELSTVKDGLTNALSSIAYEKFFYNKNREGDGGFISIIIKLLNRVDIELIPLGNDSLTLVLNPSPTSGSTTDLPLTIWYRWPILRYTKRISIDNFNFQDDIGEYFYILLDILDLSVEELLEAVIEEIADDPNTPNTPVNDFISRANSSSFNPNLSVPTGNTLKDQVADILAQFQLSNINILELILTVFIKAGSVTDKFDNIKAVFLRWIGAIEPKDILQIITPQLSISINNISLGLEFPLYLFRKIDPATQVAIDERSMLIFNIGKLSFNSSEGFNFKNTQSFTFPKSEILRTGLTLEIVNAQIDLNTAENLLPNSSSYPTNFKGSYIDQIVIGLPVFWQKGSGQSIDITGRDILVGTYKDINEHTQFVFNGTVGLEDPSGQNTILSTTFPSGLGLALNQFNITFLDGAVVSSSIQGTLSIPKKGGGSHDVQLTGAYQDNGFSISATGATAPLITLPLGDFGELFISEITTGAEDGVFYLSFKAGLEYNTSFPILDQFIPNPILLEQFKVSKNGIEEFAMNLKWDEVGQNFVQSLSGEQERIIPLGWNLFDILFVNFVKLRTELDLQSNLPSFYSQALIDGALQIGPLHAAVGDVGAELAVTYVEDLNDPDAPTNADYIGPLAFTGRFIPPSKVKLSIDAEKVKGGGALWFDYDNQRYSGALQLDIADKINLAAIGILAFKTPDGSKQFSFFAVITAEFPPVHLAYGFWLTGAGGLLGLHRGMAPKALKQSLKTGNLDQIFFPEDPVANFDSIVTGIDSIFPITQGQFIVGPLLQLGWGAQDEKTQVLRIELGLMIELPNPVRIALPGIIKTILPKEDSKVIALKAAFIALLDFGAKTFSVDVSLYDSHILKKFTLSGDIALRLRWGANPMFILSAGGFHPEYNEVPEGLTNMRRMSVSIFDKPNAKIRLEAYFAVTSNSVQVGANVDLRFAAGDKGHWQVVGYVYFDALFQFNPFQFTVAVGAGLAVTFKDTPIIAVDLAFRLQGPSPWVVQGKASFSIVGIEFKVKFDKTFGERVETTVPNIDLLPLIKEALEQPDAWRALPPARSSIHELVSLKAVAGQEQVLLLQPYGLLSVIQSVAPLETKLDKYGERRLIGGQQKFTITELYLVQSTGNTILGTTAAEELFAPAQYRELDEQEKLKSPAFQQFPAGIQLEDDVNQVELSSEETLNVAYEQILLEETPISNDDFILESNYMGMVAPETEEFETMLGNHAVSNTELAEDRNPTPLIQLNELRYFVVSKVTLQPFANAHNTAPTGYARSRAEEWLADFRLNDPVTASLLQVVPQTEMVAISGSSSTTTAIDKTVLVDSNDVLSL